MGAENREIALSRTAHFDNTDAFLRVFRGNEAVDQPVKSALRKRDVVTERVRLWLRDRLDKLQLGSADKGSVIVNPWNTTHGLGLQSVSLRVTREERGKVRDVLLPEEWKHPTVGVVADGLVDSGKMVEGIFGIEEGKAEEITGMSDGFRMDGAEEGKEGGVRGLEIGQKLLVSGPDAVRTYLWMKNAGPDQVRAEVRNQGVFVCRFLRNEK